MTGGDAYKAKLFTDDALDAAIATYFAHPSRPCKLKVGKQRLDVVAAVNGNALARIFFSDASFTAEQRRMAVRTAILLAPVG